MDRQLKTNLVRLGVHFIIVGCSVLFLATLFGETWMAAVYVGFYGLVFLGRSWLGAMLRNFIDNDRKG